MRKPVIPTEIKNKDRDALSKEEKRKLFSETSRNNGDSNDTSLAEYILKIILFSVIWIILFFSFENIKPYIDSTFPTHALIVVTWMTYFVFSSLLKKITYKNIRIILIFMLSLVFTMLVMYAPDAIWRAQQESTDLEAIKSHQNPDQRFVNRALSSHPTQIKVVRFLCTPRTGVPLPDQDAVNKAFASGQKETIKYFLMQPNGIPLPNQKGVNDFFIGSAWCGMQNLKIETMEYILTHSNTIPLPNQQGVNEAFEMAVKMNRPKILEYLLSSPHGIPLPDKTTINKTFDKKIKREIEVMPPKSFRNKILNRWYRIKVWLRGFTRLYGSSYDNLNTIKYLLTRPSGIPLPGEENLINAYKEAFLRENPAEKQQKSLEKLRILVKSPPKSLLENTCDSGLLAVTRMASFLQRIVYDAQELLTILYPFIQEKDRTNIEKTLTREYERKGTI